MLRCARMDQEEIKRIVQQNLITFVKALPKHVSGWNLTLQASRRHLQTVLHEAEQLRHIQKLVSANLKVLL